MTKSEFGEQGAKSHRFDPYADSYDELHRKSIRASGESTEYFAKYKLECLLRAGIKEPILDFGCGIGNLTEQLILRYERVHGYDPSAPSLAMARARAGAAVFHDSVEAIPDARFATAILSGVLHHLRPNERTPLVASVKQKLAPGGTLVVFEHNPWNPLTRRAVAACPFDDDAELLWPWEVRLLLHRAGFTGISLRYIVFFPKFLAALRPLEPKLSRLFFGAQTMCTAENAAAR